MSRLSVPRSLHTSNILGQSQETDSDAESIRCRVVNMFHDGMKYGHLHTGCYICYICYIKLCFFNLYCINLCFFKLCFVNLFL